ncbi:hypothetical protein FHR71_004244 [Methylobacterium sp. RAS18]|nr:hypothetical protein [Methylobacterium sp. RAS18]
MHADRTRVRPRLTASWAASAYRGGSRTFNYTFGVSISQGYDWEEDLPPRPESHPYGVQSTEDLSPGQTEMASPPQPCDPALPDQTATSRAAGPRGSARRCVDIWAEASGTAERMIGALRREADAGSSELRAYAALDGCGKGLAARARQCRRRGSGLFPPSGDRDVAPEMLRHRCACLLRRPSTDELITTGFMGPGDTTSSDCTRMLSVVPCCAAESSSRRGTAPVADKS